MSLSIYRIFIFCDFLLSVFFQNLKCGPKTGAVNIKLHLSLDTCGVKCTTLAAVSRGDLEARGGV